MKFVLKRIGAYLIDIIIVSLVAALLTSNTYINKDYKKYTETYDKYNKMCTISQFYEVSKEENEKCYTEHIDMTINYIKENWKSDQAIKYCVWGITQPANRIIKYIENNYKNAQLTYVYDKNKQIEFCGVKAKDPKEIEHDSDTFIFVCSASAFHDAEKLMKHMGKNNYFQCSGDGVMK